MKNCFNNSLFIAISLCTASYIYTSEPTKSSVYQNIASISTSNNPVTFATSVVSQYIAVGSYNEPSQLFVYQTHKKVREGYGYMSIPTTPHFASVDNRRLKLNADAALL